jgi:hypothetical protein
MTSKMNRHRARGAEVSVIAAAMILTVGSLLGSCTGVVSDPSDPGVHGGPADPTGRVSALCQTVDPGPAVIRRMTRLEYSNTLRDLLGIASGAADTFPTEERRLGFDNNAAALSTSPVLVEQYMLAAEKAATSAVNGNLASIVPCDAATAGVDACGQQFINAFGAKAYRRPLDADDITLLTTVFDVGKATDFKTGVRLVIETILQSPRFLYRVEFGATPRAAETFVKLDNWEMASRLSYLLWHSMPDDALLAAAEAGTLSTPQQIGAQVDRMLQDPKARGMVADFYNQWLHVGDVAAVEKEATAFPAFSSSIAGLMQQETTQFLDYVTWDGDGDLNAIFSAPFTFLNGPLAQYYGVTGVSGNAFVKASLDPTQRAGFLTQGGILSLLGKADQTSPVHRGKFVREQLLCTELPPPPADLMIKPPELSTTLTTRERFTQHATDMACTGCHRLMDPIGLGFENFDGAGMFRATENGRSVDASGEVLDSDIPGPFNGALELQSKLAGSDQVRACVATKWFRYGYGRGEIDKDACSLGTIKNKFAAGGYKFRDLLVSLTQSDAFLYRRITPPAGVGP